MKKLLYLFLTLTAFVAALFVLSPYPDSGAPEDSYVKGMHGLPSIANTTEQEDIVVSPTIPKKKAAQRIFTPSEKVTVKVGDASFLVDATSTLSAFDAMLAAQKEGLQLTYRNYPGLGAFIDSIQGQKAPSGYSWILLINNATSTVGASSLMLNDRDKIEWVLDRNK